MPANIPDTELEEIISAYGPQSFTTKDFIEKLQMRFPTTWAKIEAEYGAGGKGAGKYYSAYSRTSQALNSWVRQGRLTKAEEYEDAPEGWGSPVIRRWNVGQDESGTTFANEVNEEDEHWEGAVVSVLVNRYERDPAARKACIAHFGSTCQVCEIDFSEKYGEHGSGFIHVHHIVPLSEAGKAYKVDPVKDLIPVCPNCHAMLHRGGGISVGELRKLLE